VNDGYYDVEEDYYDKGIISYLIVVVTI